MKLLKKIGIIVPILILMSLLFSINVNAAKNASVKSISDEYTNEDTNIKEELSEKIHEVKASDAKKEDIINIINGKAPEDGGEASVEDILAIYNEITEKYSHEELAQLIEDNKEEISKELDIKEEDVEKGADFLRNTDEKSLKNIINQDLDWNQIKDRIDNGEDFETVVTEYFTPEKIAELGFKVLLANVIVKQVLLGISLYLIFKIIVRWIIFAKAKKHGWAAIVPIYNEITYLNVCKISPWFILLNLIPILGNIAYTVVKIVSRFKLSYAFGRGALFGLGLLFLDPIFELILAAEKNTYVIEEE